jgi:hypothetical protein
MARLIDSASAHDPDAKTAVKPRAVAPTAMASTVNVRMGASVFIQPLLSQLTMAA